MEVVCLKLCLIRWQTFSDTNFLCQCVYIQCMCCTSPRIYETKQSWVGKQAFKVLTERPWLQGKIVGKKSNLLHPLKNPVPRADERGLKNQETILLWRPFLFNLTGYAYMKRELGMYSNHVICVHFSISLTYQLQMSARKNTLLKKT